MKRRALLLSGGISRDKDRPRYRNDVIAYYRLLVDTYGYHEEDVEICLGPGPMLPVGAGGKPRPTRPATRQHVLASLRWLAELTAGDRAFIMMTDHGDPAGISLWGKGKLPDELAAILCPSAASKVIVLGQCYAGVFGAKDYGSAVVCCACGEDEQSHPCPPPSPGAQPLYNEFLYQLAGAFGGAYPDGRALPVGDLAAPPAISVGEAFRFAREHDHWVSGTRLASELPRIFDPAHQADLLAL